MADSTYEQPLPVSRTRAAATAHPWKGRCLAAGMSNPEMAVAGLWTTPTDLARAGVELQKALIAAHLPRRGGGLLQPAGPTATGRQP